MSSDWRVIRFDPFTHEVTSKNRITGEIVTVVVPPDRRGDVSAFLQSQSPGQKALALPKADYRSLFFTAMAFLLADALVRLYGK